MIISDEAENEFVRQVCLGDIASVRTYVRSTYVRMYRSYSDLQSDVRTFELFKDHLFRKLRYVRDLACTSHRRSFVRSFFLTMNKNKYVLMIFGSGGKSDLI